MITEYETAPYTIFLEEDDKYNCFISEIKPDNTLKQLAIIYSISFYHKIASALYDTGASYCISKPFEISKLRKVFKRIIEFKLQEDFLQHSVETFLLAYFLIIPDSTNLYYLL